MAKRAPYVWEIGVMNLRASYEQARAARLSEEDAFFAPLVEAMNTYTPDPNLVEAIELAFDDLSLDLA